MKFLQERIFSLFPSISLLRVSTVFPENGAIIALHKPVTLALYYLLSVDGAYASER